MAVDRVRRTLLIALPAATLAQLAPAASEGELEVHMVARRFQFEPETLRVRAGVPVLLRLTAPEVPMGFNLPDFGVRTDIVPGKEAQLRFTPTRTGQFTFLCDVFCGNGHENMSGTLEVHA
jgi:cytochrome c oxidase subunit 2